MVVALLTSDQSLVEMKELYLAVAANLADCYRCPVRKCYFASENGRSFDLIRPSLRRRKAMYARVVGLVDVVLELYVSEVILCSRFQRDVSLDEPNAARLCWLVFVVALTLIRLAGPSGGNRLMVRMLPALVE